MSHVYKLLLLFKYASMQFTMTAIIGLVTALCMPMQIFIYSTTVYRNQTKKLSLKEIILYSKRMINWNWLTLIQLDCHYISIKFCDFQSKIPWHTITIMLKHIACTHNKETIIGHASSSPPNQHYTISSPCTYEVYTANYMKVNYT